MVVRGQMRETKPADEVVVTCKSPKSSNPPIPPAYGLAYSAFID